MKKLFFIDFDNTIFSHQTNCVPQSALRALAALQKNGHKFILASGRDVCKDSEELSQHHLNPDGFISANGAMVEAEGHILFNSFFDPKLQKQLFDFVREKKYCLIAKYDDQLYASNLKHFLPPSQTKGTEFLLSDEAFLMLYDKPLRAVFLQDSPEAIKDVQSHFPELKLLCMGEEIGGADIVPAKNNKSNGIPLILDYYGASPENTVAIGDSMNDLEMIRRAGFGIAMGNAMAEVRKTACYVAKSIDEDGLSDAIQYALSQSNKPE